MDIFVKQVNCEEKSHADWTNRHILEQMNREEKKNKAVSFQSTNKDSMTGRSTDFSMASACLKFCC